MTVHFIGAGPGDPDLITVKGKKILRKCTVCFYAGSIIPKELLKHCSEDTIKINTAPMSLSEIINKIEYYFNEGHEIARLHSGDLSVWSAVNEQIKFLKKINIPFTLTPGVTSVSAASASLKQELTVPGLNQTVILTRTQGRASNMPEKESLENFAKSEAVLAIHLSIQNIETVVEKLKFISFDDAQTKFKKIDENKNHVTNSKYTNRINDIKNDKIKKSLLELTKLFKQR